MQNETQNQDTQAAPQQQPVVEEAQAAPEQAMDATQAATSEVVHDAPPRRPSAAGGAGHRGGRARPQLPRRRAGF